VLTEGVSFYSEGEKVSALWRTPAPVDGPLRAIVHSPGWRGWKDSDLYLRYHRALTGAGFGVLVLDYRGTGGSEGAPILSIRRQFQDLLNAVTYLTTRPDVDTDAIAALGSGGTGGSNAVLLAAVDERVSCAVSQLPLATGPDWLHRMRSESDWLDFLDQLDVDRRERVVTGRERTVEVGTEVMVPPPEKRSPGLAAPSSQVPTKIPASSVEELVGFDPLGSIAGLGKPVLLVAVERDSLTPMNEVLRLYEAACGPREVIVQRHTSHYNAHDRYGEVISERMVGWFEAYAGRRKVTITTDLKEALTTEWISGA